MRHSVAMTSGRRLASLLGAVSLMIAAGCQAGGHHRAGGTTTIPASTTVEATWVAYHDPTGVSFTKPADWTVVPGQEGPLVVYIDPSTGVPFRRNVNILHQVETVTLDEYTTVTKRELAGISDFTQTSLGPVTFAGRPGMRIVYSATLPGAPLRLEILSEWTIVAGSPWLVTYTSDPARFQAGLASAQRLIDSIMLPGASAS